MDLIRFKITYKILWLHNITTVTFNLRFSAKLMHCLLNQRVADENGPRVLIDLQKEEKGSLNSSGRGKASGGSGVEGLLLIPTDSGSAKAVFRLLNPSMKNENAPKVRQLCSRAWGAPIKHEVTPSMLSFRRHPHTHTHKSNMHQKCGFTNYATWQPLVMVISSLLNILATILTRRYVL